MSHIQSLISGQTKLWRGSKRYDPFVGILIAGHSTNEKLYLLKLHKHSLSLHLANLKRLNNLNPTCYWKLWKQTTDTGFYYPQPAACSLDINIYWFKWASHSNGPQSKICLKTENDWSEPHYWAVKTSLLKISTGLIFLKRFSFWPAQSESRNNNPG